jgi:hypothetical protein
MRRAAFLGVTLLAFAGVARAEEPAAAGVESLKRTVREWCEARTRILYQCPTCGGDGRLEYLVSSRRRELRPCPRCVRGSLVDEKKALVAFHAALSPAARTKAKADEVRAWARDLSARPGPGYVKSCAIERNPALIGSRCAEVSVRVAGDPYGPVESRNRVEATRWIRLDNGKGVLTWFLYSPGIDPEWGSEPEKPAPKPVPISSLDLELVAQAMAAGGAKSKPSAGRLEGTILVLDLPVAAKDEAGIATAVDADVYDAMKAGIAYGACDAVRLDFKAEARDPDGHVAPRTYRSYGITRKRWSEVKWENLDGSERIGRFKRTDPPPLAEGWRWWFK